METSMIKTLADLASATSNISEILLHYYKKIGFDKTPTGSTAPTVEPRPSTGNTYGNHQAMPMGDVKKMPTSERGITRVNDMSSHKAMSVDDVKYWSESETGINRVNDMPSFINQFGGHVGAQTYPSDTVNTIPDPNVRISNGDVDKDPGPKVLLTDGDGVYKDHNKVTIPRGPFGPKIIKKDAEKNKSDMDDLLNKCLDIDKELRKVANKSTVVSSPTNKKRTSHSTGDHLAKKKSANGNSAINDKK